MLGWELRRSTPDVALLGASGRFGLSGELLFERQRHSLLFATFVQLENAIARALWTAIASRHRQVVRDLLEQASARNRLASRAPHHALRVLHAYPPAAQALARTYPAYGQLMRHEWPLSLWPSPPWRRVPTPAIRIAIALAPRYCAASR